MLACAGWHEVADLCNVGCSFLPPLSLPPIPPPGAPPTSTTERCNGVRASRWASRARAKVRARCILLQYMYCRTIPRQKLFRPRISCSPKYGKTMTAGVRRIAGGQGPSLLSGTLGITPSPCGFSAGVSRFSHPRRRTGHPSTPCDTVGLWKDSVIRVRTTDILGTRRKSWFSTLSQLPVLLCRERKEELKKKKQARNGSAYH